MSELMRERTAQVQNETRTKARGAGLVICDGDDTLWATQPLYETAKKRFVNLIRHLPVTASTALKRLDEIDEAAVEASPAEKKFSP